MLRQRYVDMMLKRYRRLACTLALLGGAAFAGCRRPAPPTPTPAATPAPAPSTAPSVSPRAPASPARDTNPLAALYVDTGVTPVLSPEREHATFKLVDGYRAELVAAEP